MSDQVYSSSSSAAGVSETEPQTKPSPTLKADFSTQSSSPEHAEPAEPASVNDHIISTQSSPIMATSPSSYHPPTIRLPNSSDLAYLASLPTPTVQQHMDPRYDSTLNDVTAQPNTEQAMNPGPMAMASPTQTPPDPSSTHYTDEGNPPIGQGSGAYQESLPPYPSQRPPFFLPPNAILSCASRDWEGTTSGGVRIQRRDTWIVGQGWGRHLRVFQGVESRRQSPTESDQEANRSPGAEGYYGVEQRGVERHRTW